jgi:hypothetical protein
VYSILCLRLWNLGLFLALAASVPTLRGVDSFEWELPHSPIQAGRPFPVTIRALTQGQIDPSVDVEWELSLALPKPKPTLVISRIVIGQSIELINASLKPFRFDGRILVHGGSSNPTELTEQLRFEGTGPTGPITLESGARLLVGRTAPAGYPGRVRIVDTRSFPSSFAAVFVVQGSGALDGWVGTNYLALGGVVPNDSQGQPVWVGPGVPGALEVLYFKREGRLRRGSAADWVGSRTGPFPLVPLELPLDSVPEFTPVHPSRIKFVSGRWSGQVTVESSALQAVLHGDTLGGQTSQSQKFSISPGQALSVEGPTGAELREGGASFNATVGISESLPADLLVRLQASDEQEIQIPKEVVIPAGHVSVSFPVSSVLDGRIDGAQVVSVVAFAPGFLPSPPLVLTNRDTLDILTTLSIPDSIEAESFDGMVQVPYQLRLSQALERSLDLRFKVTCISHPAVADAEDWMAIPPVTLRPGRDRVDLVGSYGGFPLGFTARFRVVAFSPGWEPTTAEFSVRPRTRAPAPKFVEVSSSLINDAWGIVANSGGQGWLSNWLGVEIPLRRDSDVRIDLSSTRPDLLRTPEWVTIPAFRTNAIVPVQVNYLTQPTGSRSATLVATAPDGTRGTAAFLVPDDRADSVTIEVGDRPGATFYTGLQTNVTLRLRSSLGTSNPSNGLSLFSGTLPVSFNFQGLPVLYNGEPTATFSNGVARLSMGFSGLTRAVDLLLARPDGSILLGPSLNVTATRTNALPTVNLAISLAGPPVLEPGRKGMISVVITNSGSGMAERVGLFFDGSLGPVFSNGRINDTYAVRALPPGDSVVVKIPFELAGDFVRFHTIRLRVNSDNGDVGPFDNALSVDLPLESASLPTGKETAIRLLDLTYSAEMGRFYGSPLDQTPRLVEINPDSAAVEREFVVPGIPGLTQASTVGRQLYALLNGGTNLIRIDLVSGATNLFLRLNPPGQDLAVVAGASNRVVVTGIDSRARVYLNGLSGARSSQPISWVEPDLDGAGLVGLGDQVWVSTDGGIWTPPAPGVSIADMSRVPGRPDAGWRGWRDQLLSASMGAGDQFPGYPMEYAPGLASDLTVDPSTGSIYYLCEFSGVLSLVGFSPANQFMKRIHPLEGIGSGTRLLRFGPRGIAFRNFEGRIIFLESAVIDGGQGTDVQIRLDVEPVPSTLGRHRIVITVTNAGPSVASNATVHVHPPAGDLLFDTQLHPLDLKGGGHLFSLGDLDVGQVMVRSFESSMSNDRLSTGLVSAQVYGNWLETSAGDNLQLKLRSWDSKAPVTMGLSGEAAFSPQRGELFCPVDLPSSGAWVHRQGVVVLSCSNGAPLRFFPMGDRVKQVELSEDGSVLHVLSWSGRSLFQLDAQTGIQKRQTLLVSPEFIRRLLVPRGLPSEDVIALQVEFPGFELPRNPRVVWYQAGRPAVSLSMEVSTLATGEGEGEFFGGMGGVGTALQRLRAREGQLELLGSPAAGSPSLSYLVRSGQWIVADSGEVYSASNGVYHTKLWDELASPSLTPHPTLPLLLTASADFPDDSQTHLRLWDVAAGRLVSERHIVQPMSPLPVFTFPSGKSLLYRSSTGQLQRWDYAVDDAPAVGLGMQLSHQRLRYGEASSCSILVTNLSLSTLEDCSLVLNVHPLTVNQVDSSFPAEWLSDGKPVTHIRLGRIPPLSTHRYDVILRAWEPALIPIEVSFRSATFHRRVDTAPGLFLSVDGASPPAASIDVDLGRSVGISAFAGVAGQNEIWAAHRGLRNHLIQLQLAEDGLRVGHILSVPFSPETLALDAGGTALYAAPKFGAIHRFDLRSEGSFKPIRLAGSQGEGYQVSSLACSPTQPGMLVASIKATEKYWLAALFHRDELRPRQLSLSTNAFTQLAFWSPDRLVGAISNETSASLQLMAASENGITLDRTLTGEASLSPFSVAGGSLYFTDGTAVEIATGIARVAFPERPLWVIPNASASEFYNIPLRNFDPGLGRLDVHGAEGAPPLRGYRSAVLGSSGDYLGWVGANAAVIRFKNSAKSALAYVVPRAPDEPRSMLGFAANWSVPQVSTGTPSVLSVVVSNLGPWYCSNLQIELPDNFDAQFTGWTVRGGASGGERQGSILTIQSLSAGNSLTLSLSYAGSATAGDYSPILRIRGVIPALPEAGLSTTATLRISEPPLVSVLPILVHEGEEVVLAQIPVRLSKAASSTVSCVVETVVGEATSPGDFIPISTRLTFAPGVVEAFAELRVTGDRVEELTETLRVQLKSIGAATIGVGEASVTILDNDGPAMHNTGVEIREGDQGLTRLAVPVRLGTAPMKLTRYYYQLQEESATEGIDYIKVFGFLEFPPGVIERSVEVSVVGDRLLELDERFALTFVGGLAGPSITNSLPIIIQDEDSPVGFRLQISLDNGSVLIGGEGPPNASYQLQRAVTTDGVWEALATADAGPEGTIRFRDELQPMSTFFYRVLLLP